MKFRISVILNVILIVVTLTMWKHQISVAIGDFYYRKTVYTVVAGSVSQLEKGNTKLVRDALALIWESGDAKQPIIENAGQKLGVIGPFQPEPPKQSP
ncbi:hypothetical protein [Luteolibacter soli]|uniref:Uncharacterized protein n=1 Tax=Luteolibacter soli TaxID=3135280 RepID=A0ABU9AR52_9BACT